MPQGRVLPTHRVRGEAWRVADAGSDDGISVRQTFGRLAQHRQAVNLPAWTGGQHLPDAISTTSDTLTAIAGLDRR